MVLRVECYKECERVGQPWLRFQEKRGKEYEVPVHSKASELNWFAKVGHFASPAITIVRSGSQASQNGPADHFTGSVRVQSLFGAKAPSHTSGGLVTFEPDARSAWHSHPVGQVLIVTAGTGWIQSWGGPIQEFHQGDIVLIPPGVKHWHGASPAKLVASRAFRPLTSLRI
jgi:quercetin dioxygenase-like cupin family protein